MSAYYHRPCTCVALEGVCHRHSALAKTHTHDVPVLQLPTVSFQLIRSSRATVQSLSEAGEQQSNNFYIAQKIKRHER